MSSPWFKNFAGLHCSDFELLQVRRPRTEFAIHVTFKTVQLGTLAGTLLAPCLHILRHGASYDEIRYASFRGGLMGAGLGLIAGPLLSIGYYNQSMSKIERFDQCYRLRYNGPQLKIDRMSTVGGLIGAGLFGGPGFVAGVDMGVLCGILLNGIHSVHVKI